jgi:hypothetical protein
LSTANTKLKVITPCLCRGYPVAQGLKLPLT